ncbi:MAG: hypothetical protein ACM34I_07220 [bacterium]
MKKYFSLLLAMMLVMLAAQSAGASEAGEQKNPWEKFSLGLGGFIASLESEIRLGSEGAGVDVNLEDAFDLDSTATVFRAEALYRAGESRRHRLDLSYLDIRRRGTRTLTRDIEIKDKTFTIGTTVDSSLNIKIIKGGYGYSFFQDERFDVGVGLGVYVMPIDYSVTSGTGRAESESITAPLPVLSLYANFAFTTKLFLKQNIDLFYLEYSRFKGTLADTKIALEYNVWKHVGFGLAFDMFRLSLEADGGDYPGIDFVGDIKFRYAGLMLYGKVYY